MQEGKVGRGAIGAKLVVLIVLIVAAVAVGVVIKQNRDRAAHSPETAGNKFTSAIVAKDGSTSYNMFSDAAKKKLSSEDWNSWVVFTFDKYSGGQPKFVKEESLPDPGHMYSKSDEAVRLRYQFLIGEKTYQYDIVMVQDGDTWKVAEVGGLQ